MITLVVFDLDGTLVDSRQDLANAVNAMLEERGGRALAAEAVADMVGEGATVLVRLALAAAGLGDAPADALERFLALYDARLLDHTTVYPGMLEALDQLESTDHRLSVLTNKPAWATARLLAGLGLDRRFDAVIGGDTPLGRKPDPTGLQHLMARAGATPASTLLVGDSAIDLETARRAGVRICLARYGFGYRFAPSDFRGDEMFIDSPLELLAVLLGTP